MTPRDIESILNIMPRRFTPLVNEYYYHIFNRGVNRQPIFNKQFDYARIINLLRFYKITDPPLRFSKFLQLSKDQRKTIWKQLENAPRNVSIICYCLMPNHFHLLVKQESDNGTSRFLSNFQNGYTKYINIKYNRIGHLLQGQFKAVKIGDEEQLLHISRYIHLNPYTSAVVKNLEDLKNYRWSSFPEYLGETEFQLCNKETVMKYFKNSNTYKEFVFNQADYQKELERIKHLTLE